MGFSFHFLNKIFFPFSNWNFFFFSISMLFVSILFYNIGFNSIQLSPTYSIIFLSCSQSPIDSRRCSRTQVSLKNHPEHPCVIFKWSLIHLQKVLSNYNFVRVSESSQTFHVFQRARL